VLAVLSILVALAGNISTVDACPLALFKARLICTAQLSLSTHLLIVIMGVDEVDDPKVRTTSHEEGQEKVRTEGTTSAPIHSAGSFKVASSQLV
jgi:hypothetical protein